jgi:hypothetical protein
MTETSSFKRLGQPALVAEILAWVVIGPSVLGFVERIESREVFAELGLLFLVFWVVLGTRLSEMRAVGATAARVGGVTGGRRFSPRSSRSAGSPGARSRPRVRRAARSAGVPGTQAGHVQLAARVSWDGSCGRISGGSGWVDQGGALMIGASQRWTLAACPVPHHQDEPMPEHTDWLPAGCVPPRVRPRSLLRSLAVAAIAAAGVAGFAASTADAATAQRAKVVRKSASEMTRAEADRFRRAFSYAVRKGYLDDFNDQHFDHMRNRQHGVDVLAGAPPEVMAGESMSWGYRLLPWHRAFIIEAERMLQAALRERDRAEGRNPREADRLFIPYWDAANDQGLPRWVRAFKPKGGTAIVPEDVPQGHAAYGKPVGSRYRIRFSRWPGGNIVFDRLPQTDQISRVLAHDEFVDFYNALDVVSEIDASALPGAKQGLETLQRKVPDNEDLQTVIAATSPDYPKDVESQLAAFNALLGVGYLATSEAARDQPDQELIDAVEAVYAVFRFPPHIVLHFWAGGLDPDNPDVRGTVTYFNELAVDPVFWMLHAELDRYWYTWEQSHADEPPLEDDDALFQPLTRREGAWYGGGRRYRLGALTGPRHLPYRYDSVFRTPAMSAAIAPPRLR